MLTQKNSVLDLTDVVNLSKTSEHSQAFFDILSALIPQIQNIELKLFLTEKYSLPIKENGNSNLVEENLYKSFERSRHQRLGAFFTSKFGVKSIIEKIQIEEKSKFLEPSVGIGNFILELVDKIIKSLPGVDLDSLLSMIYGFEIDEQSLEICKIRLLLKLQENYSIGTKTYHKLNLYLTDFTVTAPQGMDFLKDFNVIFKDSESVLKIKKETKFDYIFGNPPFVSFYGRRSKKLPESHRKYYLSNYEFIPNFVKNGKLNLYMFFVEHGLCLLKEKGHLIYLLDNSIYETPALYLRKWIIEHFQITSISMGIKDFENVASGQTIWHITKAPPQNPVVINNIFNNEIVLLEQQNWLYTHECKIEISSHQEFVLNKVKNFQKLVDFFPKKSIRTCCMLLNLTELFLVDEKTYKQDDSGLIMPYLEGSKSLSSPDKPFQFYQYIKYDYELQLHLSENIRIQLEKQGIKNKKRIGLGQLEVYQSPKIFIRQSSNRLVAKFTNQNFMANNSLYVLTPIYSSFPRPDWEIILIYTERLLNSKLYLYLAHQLNIIRRNVKQQPQIKVSDLRRLPFWMDQSSDFFRRIVEIDPVDRQRIDTLIYEYLALNQEEINEIECFVDFV